MFAFSVLTVNDEHRKPRFTRKRTGYITRQHICQILFKALFESDWYFCNITESRWF